MSKSLTCIACFFGAILAGFAVLNLCKSSAKLCDTVIGQVFLSGASTPSFTVEGADVMNAPQPGSLHVLVTGGAGYIGSHATLRLLEAGHRVTIIDNLSRGNAGAVNVLLENAKPGHLRVVWGDLSDQAAVLEALGGGASRSPRVDVVMHFAAVAFVGESVAQPLQYYHNITGNTISLLEGMKARNVERLVYSSTCAVYGNAKTMPITELTPTNPVNPYGRAKLAAEGVIRDVAYSRDSFRAVILRYFNVYGADPKSRLGEYPPPELVRQGRISSACFAAALGDIEELVVYGTDFPTQDGTCIRDYIHVSDLVEAHVKAIPLTNNPPALFNLGTGKGVSVRQFTEACKKVTGGAVKVRERKQSRPGDYAEVYANPAMANKVLNWTARYVDVEEGLATGWRWRKTHPRGYPVASTKFLDQSKKPSR